MKQFLAFIFLFFSINLLSQSKIDSLNQVLKQEIPDSTRIMTTIALAREHHRLPNHETTDITIAGQAIDLALENKDTIYYARALYTLGLLYRYHKQYDMAVNFHIKAYEQIASREDYVLDKMIFANNAGVSARYMADYETSVRYYQYALKLAEENQNLLNIEIASNGLGNVYMNLPGQENIGVEYFERALATAKISNNKRGMAMNYLSLSRIYDQRKEYKTARIVLNNLMDLNIEINDVLGIGISHKAIGSNYLSEGIALDKAEEHLLKAKEVFIDLKDDIQLADVSYYLAKLYSNTEQNDRAIPLLKESLETSKKNNDLGLSAKISQQLFVIYKAEDSHKNALHFHELWRNYRDSLNLIEQEIEVLALTKQYDVEKKEAEINALKNKQQLHDIQLASEQAKLRNRSLVLILIATLFATLFIIFFQKNINRKYAKRNSEIQTQLETERIRKTFAQNMQEAEVIAMRMKINPHFLFNSLNAIKLLIQQNKNEQAIEYLVQLARFNRTILDLEELTIHPLSNELKLADKYIKLELKRFDENLTYSINTHGLTNSDFDEYLIPPLLLQPYIENAIWHGLLPSKETEKHLNLNIYKKENILYIEINDNGIGRQILTHTNKMRVGKGMKITKKRIDLFNASNYANQIKIRIIDKADDHGNSKGTSVLLEFYPLKINV